MTAGWTRLSFPLDLVAIGFVSVAMLFLTLVPAAGLHGSPLHVALGIVFVFYVPGAAFTSAVFPRTGTDGSMLHGSDWMASIADSKRVTAVERVVLSLGLSVAIVPLVVLVLSFTPVGVEPGSAILTLAVLSLVLGAVGTVRRVRLHPEERFGVSLGGRLVEPMRTVGGSESKRDHLFSVVLIIGLALATTGIGYSVASPQPGERFTEFHLQTRDPQTGELTADGYPSELGAGEEATLFVGLTNQEHQSVSYTVLTQLQRLDTEAGSATVLETRELDRISATVAHNETWRQEVTIAPTMEGDDLRLAFLLYQGEPPSDPGVDNAYRSVHIWIDVT